MVRVKFTVRFIVGIRVMFEFMIMPKVRVRVRIRLGVRV